MTASARFLKYGLSLMRFFNFEKFLFYVLPKTLLKLYICQLSFIFPNWKCNRNVNSGKFSNVNNEFNVRNVRN